MVLRQRQSGRRRTETDFEEWRSRCQEKSLNAVWCIFTCNSYLMHWLGSNFLLSVWIWLLLKLGRCNWLQLWAAGPKPAVFTEFNYWDPTKTGLAYGKWCQLHGMSRWGQPYKDPRHWLCRNWKSDRIKKSCWRCRFYASTLKFLLDVDPWTLAFQLGNKNCFISRPIIPKELIGTSIENSLKLSKVIKFSTLEDISTAPQSLLPLNECI